MRTKRKRRESEDSAEDQQGGSSAPAPTTMHQAQGDMVDLFQLQMNTLRRYKNHFKVVSYPLQDHVIIQKIIAVLI